MGGGDYSHQVAVQVMTDVFVWTALNLSEICSFLKPGRNDLWNDLKQTFVNDFHHFNLWFMNDVFYSVSKH